MVPKEGSDITYRVHIGESVVIDASSTVVAAVAGEEEADTSW